MDALEYKLQLEKSNSLLLKSQYESAVNHEQTLVAETRNQLEKLETSTSLERDFLSKKLNDKNMEIDALSETNHNLKVKVGELQDEVIHLESQIATNIVAGQMVRDNPNNNLHVTTESRKPYVLLSELQTPRASMK